MKAGQKLVLLALTLPLILFSGGYAYATTISSSYLVRVTSNPTFASTSLDFATATCKGGDYATGGGVNLGPWSAPFVNTPDTNLQILRSAPTMNGNVPQTNDMPNGWTAVVWLSGSVHPGMSWDVFVVCQTPITVAGIGIPQFGSLYSAIALAAVLYFGLTVLRKRRMPTMSLPK
jgi:hypothetical protein